MVSAGSSWRNFIRANFDCARRDWADWFFRSAFFFQKLSGRKKPNANGLQNLRAHRPATNRNGYCLADTVRHADPQRDAMGHALRRLPHGRASQPDALPARWHLHGDRGPPPPDPIHHLSDRRGRRGWVPGGHAYLHPLPATSPPPHLHSLPAPASLAHLHPPAHQHPPAHLHPHAHIHPAAHLHPVPHPDPMAHAHHTGVLWYVGLTGRVRGGNHASPPAHTDPMAHLHGPAHLHALPDDSGRGHQHTLSDVHPSAHLHAAANLHRAAIGHGQRHADLQPNGD